MSNYIKHAKREFLALGYKPIEDCKENPNKWIQEQVLELLEVFDNQGHSGSSAPWCVAYFKKLALFKPLSPLQGTENEWNEVGEGIWQNNRCSHVFKGKDGRVYDSQGKVFRESNGCFYTSIDSRVYIEFPYTPKIEYVDVEDEKCTK